MNCLLKKLILCLVLSSVNSVFAMFTHTIQVKYVFSSQCENIRFVEKIDDQTKDFYKVFCLYVKGEKEHSIVGTLKRIHNESSIPETNSLIQVLLANKYAEKAQKYYGLYTAGEGKNRSVYIKEKMCSNRRKAIDLFNGVDWKYIQILYVGLDTINDVEQKKLPTVDSLIAKMVDYYSPNNILNTSSNGLCGIIDGIKESDIDKIVDVNFDKVMNDFFGAEDPIKAMFARKNERIGFVKKSADEKIRYYNEKKEPLNKEYSNYHDRYTEIKEDLNQMILKYSSYVIKVKNKLDQLSHFKPETTMSEEGFKTTSGLTDKAKLIEARINDIESKKMIEKLVKISSTIKNIEASEKTNQETMKAMCQIYYCYYVSLRKVSFDKVCKDPVLSMGNPLCYKNDHVFTVGTNRFDLSNECRLAGLSDNIATDSITRTDATKCMKDIVLK